MRKATLALAVLLAAGGFSALGANGTYVITDKWWGFVTDTSDVRKGTSVTADEIRKSVAEKNAKYCLINDIYAHPYVLVSPAEKIAPFAGQTVWVAGSISTRSLLKSNRLLGDSDGGGEGAAESNAFTINAVSITPAK